MNLNAATALWATYFLRIYFVIILYFYFIIVILFYNIYYVSLPLFYVLRCWEALVKILLHPVRAERFTERGNIVAKVEVMRREMLILGTNL